MSIITGDEGGDALEFTVEEQTGDKRRLVLTDRALPYRPIEFAGEQRAELTPYAGNPVRTLQVFGAEEEPTEVSGFWKDTFIGQSNDNSSMAYVEQSGQLTQLLTAVDLANVVNDMRRKGQRVVVQWGPRIRRGLLKRFVERWHNIHDVEWTMRFEWTDQNDPDVPAVFAKDTDYANAQGTIEAAVQKLRDTIAFAQEAAADYLQELRIKTEVIAGLSDEFQATVSNATDTITPIMDQQRRLAGILDSVMTSCDDMVDFITEVPASERVLASLDPTEGPGLSVENFNRTLQTTCRDAKYSAATTQYGILKSINPGILQVFTARDDTDLRDVSTRYYGTQDEWRSLMVFNHLEESKLSSGETVFVPLLYRPLDGGA